MKIYYTYILTNRPKGTLYIGVTNNLHRRMLEHRSGMVESFTQKYDLKQLVYIEQFNYIQALNLEKRLKRWHRAWKINLIEKKNPDWCDFFEKYFVDPETSSG
jgi:putative endonuclease